MKKILLSAIILFSSLFSYSQGTWSAIAPMPSLMRVDAVSFSIGGKGYVGTGNVYGTLKNDFWAYDTLTDTWTQKANFGGTARDSATGFAIDSLGYIGLGHDGGFCTDFWKYSPASNTWSTIATFPGTPRSKAVGVSFADTGYVLFGRYNAFMPSDFWKYNSVTDSWSLNMNYPGPAAVDATGFVIGTKIYIYLPGVNPNFYVYDPSNVNWIPKPNTNFNNAFASSFAIGTDGYVVAGWNGSNYTRDVWKYNSVADTWQQVGPYAATGYETARTVAFSLGNKGYVGMGDSMNLYVTAQNFWKFSPCTVAAPTISPSGTSTICSGDSILLTSSATANNQWYLNSSPISGATNQTYYASQNGQYTVMSSCSPQSPPVTLNLIINNIAPPICMVTVDSLSQYNVIIWDKTPYNNVQSFVVYREISTNNYQPIATIPYDSLSLYVDTTATLYFPNTGNPNAGTYRYKLQAIDSCGNSGPLGPYHNTIFMTHNGGIFTWAQLYTIEGSPNPVSSYVLMRDDFSTGNWQAVNSIAGTQQTITDPAYNAWQATANWRVQTLWSISCTANLKNGNNLLAPVTTSLSNTTNTLLSVNEISLNNLISVYPNPSSGVFAVTLPANATLITVTDVLGNIIYSTTEITKQINLSSFADGIYFLNIKTADGSGVKKIVKN